MIIDQHIVKRSALNRQPKMRGNSINIQVSTESHNFNLQTYKPKVTGINPNMTLIPADDTATAWPGFNPSILCSRKNL